MVNPHRIVGGDGPIEKAPRLLSGNFLPQFCENGLLVPEFQHFVLTTNEFRITDFLKHRLPNPILSALSAKNRQFAKKPGPGRSVCRATAMRYGIKAGLIPLPHPSEATNLARLATGMPSHLTPVAYGLS